MGNRALPLSVGMEPYPGYQLRQLLGRGGYGEVWEAETETGTRVALKFLPCTESLATAREIRTLEAVRLLVHPAMLRVNRVFIYQGYIVIDMELADGSLLDLLEAYQTEFNTPIVPEQVCLYLNDAAEALDFLNTRQHHIDGKLVAIQHCDVKPSNLLLFGDAVKLADFGLSSLHSSKMQAHRRAGTLDYLAPEVFQGRLSDRTDQYALAVTYCHLRGGRLPFTDTPSSIDRRYVRPEPDLSMLSLAEQPIIARALSRVPHDRWPSCEEMIGALTQQIS